MMKTRVNRPIYFVAVGRSHSVLGRTMATFSRILRDGSGSSLVEFALCSTILIMFWFGLVQSCLVLYSYNVVSDAARSATRYAVVRGSSCSGMPDCGISAAQLQTYLRGHAFPGINSTNLSAVVTWFQASTSQPTTWAACGGQCNDPGDAVSVQVTYKVPLNIPFWRNASLTLTSTSQMVISN